MADNKMILNEEAVNMLISSGKLRTQSDVGSLIKQMTGQILESILKGELDSHLGYKKYNRKNKETKNSRNGASMKRVKTQSGELALQIPRDRNNEFVPQLIPKGERELAFFEDNVLALYGKGMSTRDITGIIKELYGYEISAETVSKITDRIQEESALWHSRMLEPIYLAAFLDGFHAKVRVESIVRNVCVYIIIGVKLDGAKECLGFWVDSESESSKYWLSVLSEIKNRGVEHILIFCSDNLSGISSAMSACYPESKIQKCLVHQIRNSFRYVSYKDRKVLGEDLKVIYKASTESEGLLGLEKFKEKWDIKYPYISKSWLENWEELSLYFQYSPEIRRLIYTTNAIESVNRLIRRRIKTRNVFPTLESLSKVVYLSLKEISEKWTQSIPNWGLIISQLRIHFSEILEPYLKKVN